MREKVVSHWLVLGLVMVAGRSGAAELELPHQVPEAKITQQVGLTEIAVEYECPAAKGRKIWGGVVPYDRPWLLGATAATKIRFSRDVTIGDKVVPPGTYWLVATPSKASWVFTINKSPNALVSPADYKPELDVARVKVPVKTSPHRERIAFLFSDLGEDRASLDFEWDNVRLSLPIKVNTNQQIEAAIGNLDDSWRSFANAARYMLETKKDYDRGLKYIDQSLALQSVDHVRDWYSLWIKGALLAAKGQFREASELAQSAYDLARASGPFPLEPDLARSLADWTKKRSLEKERAVALAPQTEPPPQSAGPPAPSPGVAPTAAKGDAQAASAATGKSTAAAPAASPGATTSDDDPPLRRARLRHR
jgi:hypothetical protein